MMSNSVSNEKQATSNEDQAAMPKLKISRSKVIAEALVAHGELEEVVAEGYCFYAQEASEFAAASQQVVSEVLGRGGEYWDYVPRSVDAANRGWRPSRKPEC